MEFLGKLDSRKKETFGFKSNKCSPYADGLSGSESDLLMRVHNVEFRTIRKNFESKLRNDTKPIKNTEDLLINGVKYQYLYHIYIMSKETYHKCLTENYNKRLQKSKRSKVNGINLEAKTISEKHAIGDRIKQMKETEAFNEKP